LSVMLLVAVNISSWRSAINALQTPDLDRRETSKKDEERVNRRRKGTQFTSTFFTPRSSLWTPENQKNTNEPALVCLDSADPPLPQPTSRWWEGSWPTALPPSPGSKARSVRP
jgi:hypothetical protein